MVKSLDESNTRTAEELSTELRSVSVSQFFEKNRHLLGYDNPVKALLTVVREAVDNSADACEEARIVPEIMVSIKQVSENRFNVVVEDNGPGIVKEQIPKVFASLLYGSKFHRLRQSRGVQGIGISSAVLYSQLTTGKPAKITSRTSAKGPAYYYELHINIEKNEPDPIVEREVEWDKNHGIRLELELEAKYQKGKQSVDNYIKQTAIVNPHITIIYGNPLNETLKFERVTKELPKEPKQIKPHPYGVELGILIRLLKSSKIKSLQTFLQKEFSRVSPKISKEICDKANLLPNAHTSRIARQEADSLLKAIKEVKIMNPSTNVLSPIGEKLMKEGLDKEINAEFCEAVTRPPSVYRGMPFQVECALAYGGNINKENSVELLRFANRVPLLYQQGACAITKAVSGIKWRLYGLQQSSNSLPKGPVVITLNISSVWVPFTSESKEAIAHYPEIIKEMKLALQECGRKMAGFIRKRVKSEYESNKKSYIEKYLPHIGIGLREILDLSENNEKKVLKILKETLENSRK